uniref:Complex I-MWFE n=1 Tax=Syphacia muris TaxID=451379 RepID=A0A0N5AQ41_9BILA
MWYEYLYSGGITVAFVAAALYMPLPFNLWGTGRPNRRNYGTKYRYFFIQRYVDFCSL